MSTRLASTEALLSTGSDFEPKITSAPSGLGISPYHIPWVDTHGYFLLVALRPQKQPLEGVTGNSPGREARVSRGS